MIETALMALPLMRLICDVASAHEVEVAAVIQDDEITTSEGTTRSRKVELRLHHRPTQTAVQGEGSVLDSDPDLMIGLASALAHLASVASRTADADMWRSLLRDVYNAMRLT